MASARRTSSVVSRTENYIQWKLSGVSGWDRTWWSPSETPC